MIRIYAVTCYWSNTGRMRRELIEAKDEKHLLQVVQELGGYRIRTYNETYNHLPNKHQIMKAKKYKIDTTGKTRKELREIIKLIEKKSSVLKD